ncbi:JAB domain-containing protein [uncultured Gilliamella sp.]|uniref:JAB domain-containing protein n=1 Tax=uncultured Gilliamella sp. TaxID=1193505 RepID=UPI0025CD94B4|nr:JAB domain-containing protein [uncultured Gilliamella sp.]
MTIVTINEHDLDIINQAKAIIAKYIHTGKKLCCPNDVKDYFILNFGLYEYEMFGVLYLNQQNQVIKFEELFRGTINETSVYPREIAKQTLIYNALSVILVHNHPSGERKPSQQDIRLTKKIEQVLSLIDVTVLDHFIVAKHNFLSLKKNGYY